MSYFAEGMPRPEPNMDDEGFWRHCAQRRLMIQCCAECGAPRHPPTPVCWKCRSLQTAWTQAPARAEVFTYTVVHHALHDAVAGRTPYVVALVSFPDLPGPRLVTNITDVDPERVCIGMPVTLWWDDVGGGMFLPRFRPANEQDQKKEAAHGDT
jgi:uncharacterized OB-fold protein